MDENTAENDALEVLKIVREELRAERQYDPSTYNVWSRVSSAIDRAETRVIPPEVKGGDL